jgi:hypothetical protein
MVAKKRVFCLFLLPYNLAFELGAEERCRCDAAQCLAVYVANERKPRWGKRCLADGTSDAGPIGQKMLTLWNKRDRADEAKDQYVFESCFITISVMI